MKRPGSDLPATLALTLTIQIVGIASTSVGVYTHLMPASDSRTKKAVDVALGLAEPTLDGQLRAPHVSPTAQSGT